MELTLDGIGKQYDGAKWALQDVSLTLRPGVLGLLGPNGAGKSTLLSIMSTILRPTKGQLRWNGVPISTNPNPYRTKLGYLPQDFGVYPRLSTVEFLEYMAVAKGLNRKDAKQRITWLLAALNLEQFAKRYLETLSGGTRQRVGIAQALLNDPDVLILDEPTVGLDPEERVRFRELISEFCADRIVILSSHIVSDVEAIASELLIINGGKMVAHAGPEALLASVQGKVWERYEKGVRGRIISEHAPLGARPLEPVLEDAYLYWTSAREGERKQA